MEKKKKYIKPTTEVIVLHGNTTILAASLEMIAGARRWRGEVPTTGKEWGGQRLGRGLLHSRSECIGRRKPK